MNTAKHGRSTGWRFQFGLRALFGLVTVAALMLAAVVYLHHRLSQQWQAIEEGKRAVAVEIERLDRISESKSYPHPGINATTVPQQWFGFDLSRINQRYVEVRRLTVIGKVPVELVTPKIDQFPKLVSLRLESASLKDRDLRLSRLANLKDVDVHSDSLDGSFLSQLPPDAGLAELSLRSERLDDSVLRSACRFSSLTSLQLMGLRLESAATLSELGELTRLESLSLSGEFSLAETKVLETLPQLHSLQLAPGDAKIDDDTFARLCRCQVVSDLQLLDLALTRPESMQQLARLPKLYSLDLHGDFPSEGLEVLATLPELEFAALDSHLLSNDGIRRVAQSPTIYHLTIVSEQIDDEVLDDLAAMPSLRELTLWNTKVTMQGIGRLRSKRPDIDVSRQPRD
jgi:hypothetical protein